MSTFEQKYIKHSVQLFDEQKEFIKLMVHKRRCILSAKTGAGKTLCTLYAFGYLKEKGIVQNLLVLTPLSAYEKDVWKKDMQKFTSFSYITVDDLYAKFKDNPQNIYKLLAHYDVIYGKHTHIKQEGIYTMLGAIALQSTTLLCIDEIHAFRNPKSALTLALKTIAKPCKAFWGITATTISRNIENLYNLVDLVYPWYLGPWTMFRDTYVNTMQRCVGTFGGKKRMVTECTTLKDPVGLQKKLEPILLTGESFFELHHRFVDYELNNEEQDMYTKITKGIQCTPDAEDPEEWFKALMSDSLDTTKAKKIGNVEQFSNRFVYLQYAADGIIQKNGEYTRQDSTKMHKLVDLCKEIVAKKQSVIVYFDYLASVDMAHKMLSKYLTGCTILESTGEHKLKEGIVTEGSCKQRSHILLCTRASSESVSYYFINNVIFFHNPTVPSTAIQLCGRITRKNSLYPDDLNCYWFRSQNIDLYKMLVVSGKTRLMEQASGETEANIPDDYKILMEKATAQARYRKLLLWQS